MSEIIYRSTNLENLQVGELKAKYSAAGDRVLRYYIDFRHLILDLHKEISAPDLSILQSKTDTLVATWDKKYYLYLKRSSLAAGKDLAESMTQEFENKRNFLKNLLNQTLIVDDKINWEVLKDHSKFEEQRFAKSKPKALVTLSNAPTQPEISFWQKLFGKEEAILANYRNSVRRYKTRKSSQAVEFAKKLDLWSAEKVEWEHGQEQLKKSFTKKQNDINNNVESLKVAWDSGETEAILEHAILVLEKSDYEEMISKEFDVEFDAVEKILLVEYMLPSPDDLPSTKIVKFSANTGELKETSIAAKDLKSLFEDVCYQVCLRTIHEIFEADHLDHIQNILFNGTTKYVDKGTGQETQPTIISLLVDKTEFSSINLARVDPKSCFKKLKGVSAASLIGLSPIAPIMELNKSDKRFVEAREAILHDDGSTNLASMDWEEFEHLVREVFDKEFSLRGGEVKVTQSSSDGGVDAVAFDPDPISGGKIVIQAKRYTRTVGVAAVRDLYGTTLNEGAIKGILVTTSDFGPDAYKFAADKPLTLMTGSNLLHLLSSHGIKAKIDLKEARKEMGLST